MAKHQPTATPKYRRQRQTHGTDRAFVELNGKRHYLGPYNSPESKQAYHRLLAEWSSHGQQLPVEPEEVTVMELAARFWAHAQDYYCKPDGTPTSELDDIRQALWPLKKLYGYTRASRFGPKSLKAVRKEMIDKGWCRTNVNRAIGRVKRLFRWAVENELVSPTILHGLQAVAGLKRGRSEAKESKPIKSVPDAHIQAIMPHVSRQVWALVQLQLFTGARAGELVRLRSVDLDTAGKIWTASPEDHKTAHHDRSRTIYFGPQAQAILAPFMSDRAIDACLLSPIDAERERRALSPTHRRPDQKPGPRKTDRTLGDHYTPASYRRAIDRACRDAGIPVWTPHRLRHTAATSIRKQFGVEAAQVMLGHAKADVTQLYAEVNYHKALEVAADR